LGLFLLMFLGLKCDKFCFYFSKSPLYCCYSAQYFSLPNKIIILDFCCKSCWFLVQNHVYMQSTAQGPSEDCGR
jgi:hypothetical protein